MVVLIGLSKQGRFLLNLEKTEFDLLEWLIAVLTDADSSSGLVFVMASLSFSMLSFRMVPRSFRLHSLIVAVHLSIASWCISDALIVSRSSNGISFRKGRNRNFSWEVWMVLP